MLELVTNPFNGDKRKQKRLDNTVRQAERSTNPHLMSFGSRIVEGISGLEQWQHYEQDMQDLYDIVVGDPIHPGWSSLIEPQRQALLPVVVEVAAAFQAQFGLNDDEMIVRIPDPLEYEIAVTMRRMIDAMRHVIYRDSTKRYRNLLEQIADRAEQLEKGELRKEAAKIESNLPQAARNSVMVDVIVQEAYDIKHEKVTPNQQVDRLLNRLANNYNKYHAEIATKEAEAEALRLQIVAAEEVYRNNGGSREDINRMANEFAKLRHEIGSLTHDIYVDVQRLWGILNMANIDAYEFVDANGHRIDGDAAKVAAYQEQIVDVVRQAMLVLRAGIMQLPGVVIVPGKPIQGLGGDLLATVQIIDQIADDAPTLRGRTNLGDVEAKINVEINSRRPIEVGEDLVHESAEVYFETRLNVTAETIEDQLRNPEISEATLAGIRKLVETLLEFLRKDPKRYAAIIKRLEAMDLSMNRAQENVDKAKPPVVHLNAMANPMQMEQDRKRLEGLLVTRGADTQLALPAGAGIDALRLAVTEGRWDDVGEIVDDTVAAWTAFENEVVDNWGNVRTQLQQITLAINNFIGYETTHIDPNDQTTVRTQHAGHISIMLGVMNRRSPQGHYEDHRRTLNNLMLRAQGLQIAMRQSAADEADRIARAAEEAAKRAAEGKPENLPPTLDAIPQAERLSEKVLANLRRKFEGTSRFIGNIERLAKLGKYTPEMIAQFNRSDFMEITHILREMDDYVVSSNWVEVRPFVERGEILLNEVRKIFEQLNILRNHKVHLTVEFSKELWEWDRMSEETLHKIQKRRNDHGEKLVQQKVEAAEAARLRRDPFFANYEEMVAGLEPDLNREFNLVPANIDRALRAVRIIDAELGRWNLATPTHRAGIIRALRRLMGFDWDRKYLNGESGNSTNQRTNVMNLYMLHDELQDLMERIDALEHPAPDPLELVADGYIRLFGEDAEINMDQLNVYETALQEIHRLATQPNLWTNVHGERAENFQHTMLTLRGRMAEAYRAAAGDPQLQDRIYAVMNLLEAELTAMMRAFGRGEPTFAGGVIIPTQRQQQQTPQTPPLPPPGGPFNPNVLPQPDDVDFRRLLNEYLNQMNIALQAMDPLTALTPDQRATLLSYADSLREWGTRLSQITGQTNTNLELGAIDDQLNRINRLLALPDVQVQQPPAPRTPLQLVANYETAATTLNQNADAALNTAQAEAARPIANAYDNNLVITPRGVITNNQVDITPLLTPDLVTQMPSIAARALASVNHVSDGLRNSDLGIKDNGKKANPRYTDVDPVATNAMYLEFTPVFEPLLHAVTTQLAIALTDPNPNARIDDLIEVIAIALRNNYPSETASEQRASLIAARFVYDVLRTMRGRGLRQAGEEAIAQRNNQTQAPDAETLRVEQLRQDGQAVFDVLQFGLQNQLYANPNLARYIRIDSGALNPATLNTFIDAMENQGFNQGDAAYDANEEAYEDAVENLTLDIGNATTPEQVVTQYVESILANLEGDQPGDWSPSAHAENMQAVGKMVYDTLVSIRSNIK